MKANVHNLRPIVIATAAALGLAVYTAGVTPKFLQSLSPIVAAHAQDGTPKGAGGPTGEHGQRGGGAPSDVGGRGQGQGGPSGDSDAKGPKYGGEGSKPTAGTQGGKPVWAQEGIPSDLELGRLSVVRAPSHVIDKSLASALTALQPAFYDQVVAIANSSLSEPDKITALQKLVKDNFDSTTVVRIDSPLENLGLYKDLLTDGKIVATAATYDTTSNTNAALLLAAVFIGSASDKTIPVSTATVDAINKILQLTLPAGVTSEQVGAAAEAVRQAIAEAHG
ncbi:MAG TPA: hypothetical protein VKP89_04440 [Burkholderiales bacterium]|nr:hypothetical protein [Burkholderiales bacterium]